MEWRWIRLRDWRVDSASVFGFALAFAVGHGCQEDSMIWRSDELFWVGCGCGTSVSVVCWMRCGGVWWTALSGLRLALWFPLVPNRQARRSGKFTYQRERRRAIEEPSYSFLHL